jgi:hypothetical protein
MFKMHYLFIARFDLSEHVDSTLCRRGMKEIGVVEYSKKIHA